jgi:hypothetical protein
MLRLIASLAAGLTLTHGLSENEATNIMRSEVESYSTGENLCESYAVRSKQGDDDSLTR